jgi:chlorite dismutase
MASEDPERTKEVRKYLQQSHDRIFENNKKWADEMRAKKPEFFKDLTAGQAPEYLWIGTYNLSPSVTATIQSTYGSSFGARSVKIPPPRPTKVEIKC